MFRSPRPIFPAHIVSMTAGGTVVTCSVAIALLVLSSARPAAAQAAIEYGHIATSSSAGLSGLSNKINSTLSPDKKTVSVGTPEVTPDKQLAAVTDTAPNPQDANRRSLEQRAGQDAAKLTFKSVPAKAVVRIDGKPVGHTPLSMSLAPGNYSVEMEGPRMEFGKQQLNLHASESRELELRLSTPPRYPSHIELQ
jgi:hypothetical protein